MKFHIYNTTTGSLLIISLFVVLSCNNNRSIDIETVSKEVDSSLSFVGSHKCKSCHTNEYVNWQVSHHNQSMKIANKLSILGDFNNQKFNHKNTTTHFFNKDNKFYVNTIGKDGEYRDFKIKYTFGVYPLQQYIIEFDNGKYQCLTTAWDSEKKRWFNLSPDIDINHKDWLHWTGGGMNWNNMCADCHSTDVRKNYNQNNDSYNTTFNEINVSCESCHGPASAHISHYEQNLKNTPPNLYMHNNMSSTELVDKCARCHSRRSKLTDHFDYKGTYLDHYAPSLLLDGTYEVDGQIMGEDYVYGSFVQSKMYHNGVSCNDCHDVHSLQLKKEGNALCLSCHEAVYDSPKHHFHKQNTAAAQCINCHMTGKTYMGNDFRRDHSFRVPRPDQSLKYNTPNACNGCHKEQSSQWASDHIVKNYGKKRQDHFSDHLLKGYYEDHNSFLPLIQDPKYPAIARATALNQFSQNPNAQIIEQIKVFLYDSSDLVKNEAVIAITNTGNKEFMEDLQPFLTNPIRLLRISAARYFNMTGQTQVVNLGTANNEYLDQMATNSDFASGQHQYGLLFQTQGKVQEAISSYEKALKIDRHYNTSRMNLALLYYQSGNIPKAESAYLEVLKQEPDLSHPYYMLGLLYNESGDNTKSLDYFKKATKRQPNIQNAFYNYALKLQEQNAFESSIEVLNRGLELFPDNERLLYALMIGYNNSNQLKEAKSTVSRLVRLFPTNDQYKKILRNYN